MPSKPLPKKKLWKQDAYAWKWQHFIPPNFLKFDIALDSVANFCFLENKNILKGSKVGNTEKMLKVFLLTDFVVNNIRLGDSESEPSSGDTTKPSSVTVDLVISGLQRKLEICKAQEGPQQINNYQQQTVKSVKTVLKQFSLEGSSGKDDLPDIVNGNDDYTVGNTDSNPVKEPEIQIVNGKEEFTIRFDEKTQSELYGNLKSLKKIPSSSSTTARELPKTTVPKRNPEIAPARINGKLT